MTYEPPTWLSAILCKYLGHQWHPLMSDQHRSVCLVCRRCHRNAWRLT